MKFKKHKLLLGAGALIAPIVTTAAVIACGEEGVTEELSTIRDELKKKVNTTLYGRQFRSLVIPNNTLFDPKQIGITFTFPNSASEKRVKITYKKLANSSEVFYHLEDLEGNQLDFSVLFTYSSADERVGKEVRFILENRRSSNTTQAIFNEIVLNNAPFESARLELGMGDLVIDNYYTQNNYRFIKATKIRGLTVQYIITLPMSNQIVFTSTITEFSISSLVRDFSVEVANINSSDLTSKEFFQAEIAEVPYNSDTIKTDLGFSLPFDNLLPEILELTVSKRASSFSAIYRLKLDTLPVSYFPFAVEFKTFRADVDAVNSIRDKVNEIFTSTKTITEFEAIKIGSSTEPVTFDAATIGINSIDTELTSLNALLGDAKITFWKLENSRVVNYVIAKGEGSDPTKRYVSVLFKYFKQTTTQQGVDTEQAKINALTGLKAYFAPIVAIDQVDDRYFTKEVAERYGFSNFDPSPDFIYTYRHGRITADGVVPITIVVRNGRLTGTNPAGHNVTFTGIDQAKMQNIINIFKYSTLTYNAFKQVEIPANSVFDTTIRRSLGISEKFAIPSALTVKVEKVRGESKVKFAIGKASNKELSFEADFARFAQVDFRPLIGILSNFVTDNTRDEEDFRILTINKSPFNVANAAQINIGSKDVNDILSVYTQALVTIKFEKEEGYIIKWYIGEQGSTDEELLQFNTRFVEFKDKNRRVESIPAIVEFYGESSPYVGSTHFYNILLAFDASRKAEIDQKPQEEKDRLKVEFFKTIGQLIEDNYRFRYNPFASTEIVDVDMPGEESSYDFERGYFELIIVVRDANKTDYRAIAIQAQNILPSLTRTTYMKSSVDGGFIFESSWGDVYFGMKTTQVDAGVLLKDPRFDNVWNKLLTADVENGFMYETRDGTLYLGTAEGLYRRNPVDSKWEPIFLGSVAYGFMFETASGEIYLGTYEQGLFKLGTENTWVLNTTLDVGRGFMYETTKGELFLGTYRQGLYKLSASNEWIQDSTINVEGGFIKELQDGTIFLGSGEIETEDKGSLYRRVNGVWTIDDRDKEMKFITYQGFMSQLHPTQKEEQGTDGVPTTVSVDGHVFLGAIDGLYFFNKEGKWEKVIDTPMYRGFMYETTSGSIYLGTYSRGLQEIIFRVE